MAPNPLRAVLKTFLALLLTVCTALVVVSAGTPAQAAGSKYPTLGIPPAGANDWACETTRRRPHPAVIVHGTFGDQKSLLDPLSLSLKRDGFCVFSLDYGNRATGPIQDSARELKRFVNRVLGATDAGKVQIVGHSQGGMMPRYYIKNLGGAGKVEDLVGLAPSNHGTESTGSFSTKSFCPACAQQAAGSDFLTALNNPDETPGTVDYTQVVTKYDEVVTPYTSGFLTPGPRSTNITLQDYCPVNLAEHVTIPMDRLAIAWTLNAFRRHGPANADAPLGCI
ncbi:MAG TPA: alpha/beta fold hydrolase [Nocardioidaceae bacterium]|nr:alpha/beta fold hydrolase [Nocardioidaceae bacterium]